MTEWLSTQMFMSPVICVDYTGYQIHEKVWMLYTSFGQSSPDNFSFSSTFDKNHVSVSSKYYFLVGASAMTVFFLIIS